MKRIGILTAAVLLGTMTAMPVRADNTSDAIWQSAYQKVLTTYSRMQGFEGSPSKEESGSRWDLYDVDGDGTPELFISPDNSHAYGVMIYTCVDGSPKLLRAGDAQAFGEFGMCAVNTEHHMIGSFHTGMGVTSRTFYGLESGSLVELDSFMNDAESYLEDQRDNTVWQVNGSDVTSSMYMATYEPYSGIIWKEDVGRTYAFSDRSPLASGVRFAKSAAPPDMQSAFAGGSIAALILALIASLTSILMRRKKRGE